MNEQQQALLRAHYLACYRQAIESGFRYFAQAIYEHYYQQWPDELMDWAEILGGDQIKSKSS